MRNNKILILVIVFLCLAVVVQHRDKQQDVYQTAQGATVIMINEPSPFVAVNIFIKDLKAYEPKKGLANLSLEMLKCGTTKLSKLEIAAALEKIGGEFSTTVYNDFSLLSGFVLKENIEDYLVICQELILDSNYPRREFDLLRSQLLLQLRQQKEDPLRYAIQLNRQHNYPEHYYGYPAAGDIESLNSIRYSEVVSFNIQDIVSAKDLVVVVNGDFNKRKTKKLINDLLAGFSEDKKETNLAKKPKAFPGGLNEKNYGYDTSNILYNLVFPADQQGINKKPVHDLIDSYLGDGLSSPLFKTFREERGISYAVGSFYDFNRDGEVLTIYVQTKLQETKPLLTILADLTKFAPLPSPADFQKVKNYHLTTYYQQMQSLRQRGFSTGYKKVLGFPKNYDYPKEIKKVQYKDFCQALQGMHNINTFIVH